MYIPTVKISIPRKHLIKLNIIRFKSQVSDETDFIKNLIDCLFSLYSRGSGSFTCLDANGIDLIWKFEIIENQSIFTILREQDIVARSESTDKGAGFILIIRELRKLEKRFSAKTDHMSKHWKYPFPTTELNKLKLFEEEIEKFINSPIEKSKSANQ